MSEGIRTLTSWNTSTQIAVAAVSSAALLTVAAAVTLTVLHSFNTLPLALFCTGGTVLAATIIYALILSVKTPPTPAIPADLPVEEVEGIIFAALTESDAERQETMRELAALGDKKSKEDQAKERLYALGSRAAIIEHLIDTLPRLKEHLYSLNSSLVYDSLAAYAHGVTSTHRTTQVFPFLNDTHRCALLRKHINDKNLFLVLIEIAPASTKKELHKSDWPELKSLANELLDAWFFNKAFYHVYAALSDNHQKECLKRIVQESWFSSKRVEMIQETKGALEHPIEFIEYALENADKTSYYNGKNSPWRDNETTQLFDPLLSNLPPLHIVTLFWRIVREKLKVWDLGRFKFHGTEEERAFIQSLPFEQIERLNKTGQPWIAMWRPSQQSDEVLIDICFKQLPRAKEAVTDYKSTEYDPIGKLFKKNWDQFLHLLSFSQVSMLICRDPHLKDLNQIFGFDEVYEDLPATLTDKIPNSKHTRSSRRVSIPAILQLWWEWSKNEISAEQRVAAIQALHLEERYTQYLTYKHNNYEEFRPAVEASMRAFQESFAQAQEYTKGKWAKSMSFESFLEMKRQAQRAAEEAERARAHAEEEQRRLDANLHPIIQGLLTALGLSTDREYSKGEISALVRKTLFKHHPDRHLNASDAEREVHAEKFKMLTNHRDLLLKILSDKKWERTPKYT